MNFSKFAFAITFIGAITVFQSCKNDDDQMDGVIPAQVGNVKIDFGHIWGPEALPLAFNTEYTHPETSELITFSRLRYYITNIKLHKTDGTTWAENESYHIIDARAVDTDIDLSGVPTGEYNGITFLIGVDSLRNTSGAQTGALDPAETMFWSWNTGYIFVIAEGTSPAAENEAFVYHLGGFQGPHNAIREVYLPFNNVNLNIATDASPAVHINADAAGFWGNGSSISEIGNAHSLGVNASTLATNFSEGFKLDHIHN